MAEIFLEENSIVLAAAQKMVSLGTTISERKLDGKEGEKYYTRGQNILRLLTAYNNNDFNDSELEAVLYCLRDLSEENIFPTINPVLGQELVYLIGENTTTEVGDNYWNDRGGHNASANLFPSIGGSGAGGLIRRNDTYDLTAGGFLDGVYYDAGTTLRALIDEPGQTRANWKIF